MTKLLNMYAQYIFIISYLMVLSILESIFKFLLNDGNLLSDFFFYLLVLFLGSKYFKN